MPETPKFYVTTPIYYVNARPHIGHAYTTIVADVVARRHRLLGDDTFFLTGTDEHGQKIERAAVAAGIPPQQFADDVSIQFRNLWDRMGLTYDIYNRTTDSAHKRGAQKLFADHYERGAIYLSSYTSQYCVSEEIFVEGPPGTIGPDGRPTETVTEENFFFRLSDYQLPLLDLIESNTLLIAPETRRNEVLSFLRGNVAEARTEGLEIALSAMGIEYVKGALRDLSVSRSSFSWGVPIPEPAASTTEKKHVMYVWLDALANYLTGVGYGSDAPEDKARFAHYWPADLHVLGKEITRQHCIYWPAFLLAAGLPLPKSIVAHGWLLFEESKMSKSRGNIVRTETILDAFGPLCPPAPTRNSAGTPSALLKGTASAVPPQTSPDAGASAPEVPSSPTKAHPSDARANGPTHTSLGRRPREGEPSDERAESPTHTSPSRNAAEGSASASTRDLAGTPSALLKGTASAVPPQTPPEAGASAPEVPSSPTPPTKAQQDLFAADILRYYLLREIPFGQDGSFSFDALITRYNADLANGYGNLVSRVLKLIEQNLPSGIEIPGKPWLCPDRNIFREDDEPKSSEEAKSGTHFIGSTIEQFAQLCDTILWPDNKYQILLAEAALRVSFVDSYLSFHKPWILAKGNDDLDRRKLIEVLYTAAESIRIITALLYPILPYATASVWRQLGLGSIEEAAARGDLKDLQWGGLKPGTKLGPLSPIFPRADKGLAQIMTDMESPTPNPASPESFKSVLSLSPEDPTHPAAPPRTSAFSEPNPGLHVGGAAADGPERAKTPTHSQSPASNPFATASAASHTPDTPQISIDDFVKVDLRVARILVAERIPKADKLLRLEVDLGPSFNPSRRQILAGIAEHYAPETLIGRKVVIVANLAPRKMRGLESQGMLVAASLGEHGRPVLAGFLEDIEIGSRLK